MKLILFPSGAFAYWLYQNLSPETWQMIIGLSLALVISLLVMLVIGLNNQLAQEKAYRLGLSTQLANVQYQSSMLEERLKIKNTRKARPSMRRGKA